MKFQIDQSGKIEQTEKNSVLAWSNGTSGAVVLSARNKRKLQEKFREIGAPRLFVEYVFSALLVILLKKNKFPKVTVDLEYPKSTQVIESLIQPFNKTEVTWKLIGKSSRAHNIAYQVYVGKLKIGSKVSVREIWEIVSVSGEFLKKKTGGNLKIGLSPTNRFSAPVYRKNSSKKRGESQ